MATFNYQKNGTIYNIPLYNSFNTAPIKFICGDSSRIATFNVRIGNATKVFPLALYNGASVSSPLQYLRAIFGGVELRPFDMTHRPKLKVTCRVTNSYSGTTTIPYVGTEYYRECTVRWQVKHYNNSSSMASYQSRNVTCYRDSIGNKTFSDGLTDQGVTSTLRVSRIGSMPSNIDVGPSILYYSGYDTQFGNGYWTRTTVGEAWNGQNYTKDDYWTWNGTLYT